MNRAIPELPLPLRLRHRAETTPDAVLLQHVDGPTMSYAELLTDSQLWAASLQAQGIAAGATVATMMPNSFAAFSAWLGCGWLRAVEVPINSLWKGSWLEHGLNMSRAELLVTSVRFVDQLRDVAQRLQHLKAIVICDDEPDRVDLPYRIISQRQFFESAVRKPKLEEPRLRDPSGVIFTSGTTGRSKGAIIPWGMSLPGRLSCYHFWDEFDEFVWHSPFAPCHGSGKVPLAAAIGHPSARGRLVIRDGWSTPNFWAEVRRFGINGAMCPGAVANFLYSQEPRPDDADNPLVGLCIVPLIPHIDEFKKRFGVEVCTTYGMTEVGLPFESNGWDVSNRNSQACGKLRSGFSVRLVNEDDEEVSVGETGELIVRSDHPWSLNLGYLGMPEASIDAWRNGWFHTGDGMRRDEDGNYYFVDRIKDAIRRRGENISSFEVEAVVNQHPAVLESAAVAVPSNLSEDEVKVFVVLHPGQRFSPDTLIQFLNPRMPRFAIPRYIEVVDSLPKTPTQKVQKAMLRARPATETTWDREAIKISS